MNNKGFTLVELMVVVVVIGILVAIIIPVYSHLEDNAAIKVHEANLRTIDSAIALYQAKYGMGPLEKARETDKNATGVAAVDALIEEGFLTERPAVPQRLLQHNDWFSSPYTEIMVLLRPLKIEAYYYEIQDNASGTEKTFPVLNQEKFPKTYRSGDNLKNSEDAVNTFVKTYLSRT